ncbi:MAG: IS1634 family transposase [Bacteroidales bacterium]|nr:IS1634 family transposase [Bacteroidales bacterium]
MYIRITKNSRGDAYYHLVESFRHEGKVRQRVLLSLGRVEEGKLEQLAKAIGKHLDQITALNLAESIDIHQAYLYGPLLLMEHMSEKLGIRQVLSSIAQSHNRLQFDFERAVFSMVTSRFMEPVSKLGLFDRMLDRFYPGLFENQIELQHLYRSLDLLSIHKEEIERKLFYHGKDLFNVQVDVVLYDLTILRFESTRTDLASLPRFGYSKEQRSDCTQVVLGLLTDTQGIPLGFETHPGNTFEGKTLEGMVRKLRTKYTVNRFIFVADRRLFSAANLKYLRKDSGEFIVGFKIGTSKKTMQDAFYDISRFTLVNDELAWYETQREKDRYIITWSKVRAQRDLKTREDILDTIRGKLSKKKVSDKEFITNSNYKKYVCIHGKDTPVLNMEAIEKESKRDGFFSIITNVKKDSMSAERIISEYKQLWHIEDAFGELKGTFKTRPVFHWTDERIIGHIMICFLAYLCQANLTKSLREKAEQYRSKTVEKGWIESRTLTSVEGLKELNQVLAIPVKIGKQKIWVRTDIPENAMKLLMAMNMKIPPKVLEKGKM